MHARTMDVADAHEVHLSALCAAQRLHVLEAATLEHVALGIQARSCINYMQWQEAVLRVRRACSM